VPVIKIPERFEDYAPVSNADPEHVARVAELVKDAPK
jgi:hypothetical protein